MSFVIKLNYHLISIRIEWMWIVVDDCIWYETTAIVNRNQHHKSLKMKSLDFGQGIFVWARIIPTLGFSTWTPEVELKVVDSWILNVRFKVLLGIQTINLEIRNEKPAKLKHCIVFGEVLKFFGPLKWKNHSPAIFFILAESILFYDMIRSEASYSFSLPGNVTHFYKAQNLGTQIFHFIWHQPLILSSRLQYTKRPFNLFSIFEQNNTHTSTIQLNQYFIINQTPLLFHFDLFNSNQL